MPIRQLDRAAIRREARELIRTARVSPIKFTLLFLAVSLALSLLDTALTSLTGRIVGVAFVSVSFASILIGLITQVLDAGFATFARLLEARAPLHGAVVRRVDRWSPRSSRCSACGHVRRHLELDERTYICPECGLSIDRDLNAAINLRLVAVGATETKNAREGANQAAAKAA